MTAGRRRTGDTTPTEECRCPREYPITVFTQEFVRGDRLIRREHHAGLCGLPDEPRDES